ncbi:N-acetylmuramoyl-L-alanine amidase [Fervidicella metallireducens AeB]|uniref:N-acetylmuramoyl-L-alanine amidase n=1 Tax=Fervidicella metallireducens AeB TaxID=1403537 RepID=A0A017RRY8_9CLOT|nr:N-acetylmuramoyl-L-alanine amidase CwlD [Fervidicella metallireducens]EYE87361.1 N-acetylmuramoyl-L-alanine amidase [Fervidicella metallireducens AeB]
MRKKVQRVLIFIVIISVILLVDINYFHVFEKGLIQSGNRVIIIDAGHGGIDGGAVGLHGVIEKDINLAIAKKLKAYIELNGDTCIMIREVDEGLYSQSGTIRNKKNEDLKNRKTIIKETEADLFISIHLNSFPQAQYYGAQVFYPKEDEDSKRLAKFVQTELVNTLDRNNKRQEKSSDSYYILKDNKIPSLLIECGFLSNPAEERLLADEGYQNKIAWAIYSGIIKYFTEPIIEQR